MAAQAFRSQLWRTLGGLALGQLLSLLIAATGLTSSQLARVGVDAPTSQSFCNYVLLAVVYGPLLLYRRKKLQVSWYCYLLLAFVDVEANYLVVKAYQYTTITSVMLLDRGSLLFVLALTWIVLKTRYSFGQLGGVALCLVGVVILFLSDVQDPKQSEKNNLIWGDILVLIASLLYAISNVAEESLVKTNDFLELMALLGIFGSMISACQVFILELPELKSMHWNARAVAPFIGFAVSLFSFYTLVPVLLKISGSAMLNLSLITSDMWAIIIQTFADRQKIDPLYFVAFAVVAFGLVIYSFSAKSNALEPQPVGDEETLERRDTAGIRRLKRNNSVESNLMEDREGYIGDASRSQSPLHPKESPRQSFSLNLLPAPPT